MTKHSQIRYFAIPVVLAVELDWETRMRHSDDALVTISERFISFLLVLSSSCLQENLLSIGASDASFIAWSDLAKRAAATVAN